jgi:Flp pilus assembly protein TadD
MRFRFLTLTSLFACLVLVGCASHNANQQGNTGGDYKRMMKLQQQRANAKPEPEPVLPKELEATADTHEQMGDVSLKRGDLVGALTEYQKSLDKQPDKAAVRYKIGMLLVTRNQPDEALKEFEAILTKDPKNPHAYYGRARVRFLQERLDLARTDLRTALGLNDRLWQAHALLGIILDQEQHHEEAQAAYAKSLEIQPKSAAVYNDLGVSRYLSGKFKEAADAFLKAYSLEPANARICNNLGLALFRLGRTEDALEAFKRGSGDAMAYNNVGYLQLKEKKYDEARASLEKAIEVKTSYYSRAQKNLEKIKTERSAAKAETGTNPAAK